MSSEFELDVAFVLPKSKRYPVLGSTLVAGLAGRAIAATSCGKETERMARISCMECMYVGFAFYGHIYVLYLIDLHGEIASKISCFGLAFAVVKQRYAVALRTTHECRHVLLINLSISRKEDPSVALTITSLDWLYISIHYQMHQDFCCIKSNQIKTNHDAKSNKQHPCRDHVSYIFLSGFTINV